MRILALCLVAMLAFSCGKVTQEVAKEDDNPAFTLSYAVSVQDKSLQVIKPTDELVAAVFTYDAKLKRKESSWGRAVNTVTTKNKNKKEIKVYKSKSFDKRGVAITKSDNTWTLLKFDTKDLVWNITSKKIRRGNPFYLASVVKDSAIYQLKMVDSYRVSKNKTVNVGVISDYDTFLSVMQLMAMASGDFSLKDASHLYQFFDVKLFELLQWKRPKNVAQPFSLRQLKFKFDSQLEKTLLILWELSLVDKSEAKTFLKGIDPALLNTKVKDAFLKKLSNGK